MNIILMWQQMDQEDRRELHRHVACAAAIIVVILFCVVALFVAVPEADARECSLPYVCDVNPCKAGKYTVIVSVAGNAKIVKVNGKKANKIDRRTWVFKAKPGKEYRITAKPRSGKSKSISYRIER